MALKGICEGEGLDALLANIKGGLDEKLPMDGYVTAGKKDATTLGERATAEGYAVTASGKYAHAEGNGTNATENGAHSEGNGSTASAPGAHAEGVGTQATNQGAHAEGNQNKATGVFSHAEGMGTQATGMISHAEGNATKATGVDSHAEGEYTEAKGEASHAEGDGTIASGKYQHAGGKFNVEDAEDKYAVIIGNGTGSNPLNRSNAATLDWEGNAVFAGKVTAGGVDILDRLSQAVSGEAYVQKAGDTMDGPLVIKGNSGVADRSNPGRSTSLIVASYAVCSAGGSIRTEGPGTIACGEIFTSANADNQGISASGGGSFAGGKVSYGSGGIKADYSGAFAYGAAYDSTGVQAIGRGTVAMGTEVKAGYVTYGTEGGPPGASGAFASGKITVARGCGAHSEGYQTIAGDSQAHAEGAYTRAYGQRSHAEGEASTAYTLNSHVEGKQTIAYSRACHAEGQFCKAGVLNDDGGNVYSYMAAHAEGRWTEARGKAAHTEGAHAYASGTGAHAEGYMESDDGDWIRQYGFYGPMATGDGAHAEGNSTRAEGAASHAGGSYTIAAGPSQTAIGFYNTAYSDNTNALLIVGKGTSHTARANAFRVGKTAVWGAGAYNSSGADYAEMFEWEDGNPENEDRRGIFVALSKGKIRPCGDGDTDILGIVSANPSVCGDVQDDQWAGMYLADVYGSPVWEEYTDAQGRTQKRQKLNPDYDPEKEYIPRSQRPEWAAVGLLGKLVMRDDGGAVPGDYLAPGKGGEASVSQSRTRFVTLERIDAGHIKALALA